MVDRVTVSQIDYFDIRDELLRDQDRIIAAEQKYMQFLLEATLSAANNIYEDFSQAMELSPFWINYPPVQRGRAPEEHRFPGVR